MIEVKGREVVHFKRKELACAFLESRDLDILRDTGLSRLIDFVESRDQRGGTRRIVWRGESRG